MIKIFNFCNSDCLNNTFGSRGAIQFTQSNSHWANQSRFEVQRYTSLHFVTSLQYTENNSCIFVKLIAL